MSKNWQFQESQPTIERVTDPLRETGWRTSIIYDETPAQVTWYSENGGVQIESSANNIAEETGYKIAAFGLILIRIILCGKS